MSDYEIPTSSYEVDDIISQLPPGLISPRERQTQNSPRTSSRPLDDSQDAMGGNLTPDSASIDKSSSSKEPFVKKSSKNTSNNKKDKKADDKKDDKKKIIVNDLSLSFPDYQVTETDGLIFGVMSDACTIQDIKSLQTSRDFMKRGNVISLLLIELRVILRSTDRAKIFKFDTGDGVMKNFMKSLDDWMKTNDTSAKVTIDWFYKSVAGSDKQRDLFVSNLNGLMDRSLKANFNITDSLDITPGDPTPVILLIERFMPYLHCSLISLSRLISNVWDPLVVSTGIDGTITAKPDSQYGQLLSMRFKALKQISFNYNQTFDSDQGRRMISGALNESIYLGEEHHKMTSVKSTLYTPIAATLWGILSGAGGFNLTVPSERTGWYMDVRTARIAELLGSVIPLIRSARRAMLLKFSSMNEDQREDPFSRKNIDYTTKVATIAANTFTFTPKSLLKMEEEAFNALYYFYVVDSLCPEAYGAYLLSTFGPRSGEAGKGSHNAKNEILALSRISVFVDRLSDYAINGGEDVKAISFASVLNAYTSATTSIENEKFEHDALDLKSLSRRQFSGIWNYGLSRPGFDFEQSHDGITRAVIRES